MTLFKSCVIWLLSEIWFSNVFWWHLMQKLGIYKISLAFFNAKQVSNGKGGINDSFEFRSNFQELRTTSCKNTAQNILKLQNTAFDYFFANNFILNSKHSWKAASKYNRNCIRFFNKPRLGAWRNVWKLLLHCLYTVV